MSDGSKPEMPHGVRLAGTLKVNRGPIFTVAFNPQGLTMASGGTDGTVKLLEVASGKLLGTLQGHRRTVNSVVFHPSGNVLASGSSDNAVKVWESGSGKLVRTLKGHQAAVNNVTFDPEGTMLASASDDGTVRLWDAKSGNLLNILKPDVKASQILIKSTDMPTFRAYDEILTTVKDEYAAAPWWRSFNDYNVAHFLDTEKPEQTFVSEGPNWISCVAFDPLGRTLASGNASSTVTLWEARSGKAIRTLQGHRNTVGSVAFAPNGEVLASGSADKTVKLWDAVTGSLLRSLEGHTDRVDRIAFSPDGRLLASIGKDSIIRLWSTETWATAAVIPMQRPRGSYSIPAIAFHPTLPILAVVGSEPGASQKKRSRLINLWELDFSLLLRKPAATTVTYTSAKIVLVGESNVGKSYLAHRIATGVPPEPGTIPSTHGMKFWPLEPAKPIPTPELGEDKTNRILIEKLFGRLGTLATRQRRDIVLWDMGGQQEYRLIHQLFLHDTTIAIVLIDPTRGATAFKEAEAWNKSLEKQLRGRAAVKLLVGTKVDEPSEMIDREALERLCEDGGFADYCETSAISGRGMTELCEAVARAIDWDGISKTSRPELFQAIRDEIERRRKSGVVVVLFEDLDRELQTNDESEIFSLMAHEVAMASDADAGTRALEAVCSQLAQQGIIAPARTSGGKRALILRVEEVERYAGSLILAARNNPRRVPAVELQAVAQDSFCPPGITARERLPREQEKPVLECTIQLMLEHGICFQHEGLLIFPSLFAPTTQVTDAKLPHAVSLYYDFAGAIDNIYASLVAWLVLAKEFGKVRLWSDRAEFEITNGGLCGLRKVGRPGGFAHVDVYFEVDTSERQRQEFISFVEDHLARNGVEIREHVVVKCVCGHEFAEETIRQRIARGEKDVLCPVCETRHSLTEGAVLARERNEKIAQHTWALRTLVAKRRDSVANQVVRVLAKAETVKPSAGPIRLLHLSDLHFTKDTPISARLQWLADDLKQDSGLGIKKLDYLVISGDFTDKGCADGFERAYDFVSGLTREFGLSADRCIFVPGNHDVRDLREAYDWHEKPDGLKDGEWVQQGEIILARNAEKYPLRLKAFSDLFYHKFLQRPYPLEFAAQGFTIPYWETGVQFLAMNSCWQIDQFHRKRSGVHVEAVANAIKQGQEQVEGAQKTGQLAESSALLRIAVWHHAVWGPEQIEDTDFLGNLEKNGVRLVLHGDVHDMRRNVIRYWHERKIHVVGSGSFGARAADRPESTPRLYNVVEIGRDLKSAKVHTRCQPKPDGTWDGWYEWPDPDGGKGRVAFYGIEF